MGQRLILKPINTVLIILIKIINDVQAYLKNQQMLFFFLWCYYSHNIKSISYFIKDIKKIYRYSEFNIGNIRGIGEGGSNRIKHEQLDHFSNMAAPMAQTGSVHTSSKNADKKTKTCKSRRETAVSIVNFMLP